MIVLAWHDDKCVHVLSSTPDIGTTQARIPSAEDPTGFRQLSKPTSKVDYNQNMGGADRFDQLGNYYKFPHCSYKWYQVIYHFCVEAVHVNEFIFQKHAKSKYSQHQFRQLWSHGFTS